MKQPNKTKRGVLFVMFALFVVLVGTTEIVFTSHPVLRVVLAVTALADFAAMMAIAASEIEWHKEGGDQ